jgi:hypothetical protein
MSYGRHKAHIWHLSAAYLFIPLDQTTKITALKPPPITQDLKKTIPELEPEND